MHRSKTIITVITWVSMVSGCFVQIEDKSAGGNDPCTPNPCEGVGVCAGWKASCSVDASGAAVCSSWQAQQGQTGEAPELYEANETLCDGVDNDCDGLTDEGVIVDPAKDCPTVGVCEGQSAQAACVAGKWRCEFAVVPAWEVSETTCDGKDNDCDGVTDEDAQPTAKDCRRVGVCLGLPAPTCAEGKWDCKYDQAEDYEATETSCDGKDNDCDGLADVNLSINALPGGAKCEDKGLCAGGVAVVCKGGQAVCDYAGIPGYEAVEMACDGKDNDCDGAIDNLQGSSLALVNADVSECQTVGVCSSASGAIVRRCGDGKWSCDYSQVPYYEPSETLCDERDNDCDGKTDNDLTPPKISPCGGAGVCSEGKPVCSDGLWSCDWTALSAAGHELVELTCDGKDNDCDGQTDALNPGAGAANGCKTKGVCGAGVQVSCAAGKPTCDYTAVLAYEATETLCDGKDNDCDGKTDEEDSLDAKSSGCSAGVCAGVAKASCNAGVWQCSFAGVPDYESKEVTCDGKDNDCDGQTDEDLTSVVAAQCKTLGVCAGASTAVCTGGSYACSYTSTDFQTKENLCDGKDNDCDGQTDTAVCQAGQTCTASVQCATGGCAAVLGDTASVCTVKANQCAQRIADGSLSYIENGSVTCGDAASTLTCTNGSFGTPKACPTSAPACVNGACQLCAPNEQRCDAQNVGDVVKCSADGKSQSKVTTCAGKCAGAGVCVVKGAFDVSKTNTDGLWASGASLNAGGFVVVWVDKQVLYNVVVAQRFKSDGSADGPQVTVSSKQVPDQAPPTVAAMGDGFAVVWATENTIQTPGDVVMRQFDATGKALGDELVLGTTAAGVQRRPTIVTTAEGALALWESESVDLSGYGVAMQRFGKNGQKLGAQVLVNANANANDTQESGDEGWPSASVTAKGDVVVAWTQTLQGNGNVRMRRFSSDGKPLTGTFSLTQGTQNITDVRVAMTGSGTGHLVWQQGTSSSADVYYLSLSQALSAVGSPAVVHSSATDEQSTPRVGVTSSDGVVVVFQSYGNADGYDIRKRVRLPTGAWVGNDAVAVGGTKQQDQPSLLTFSDGRTLLLWRERASDIAKGMIRAEFQ